MAKPEKDDRLFAPFPIEMDEHPKIIGLSDAAFRAVFEATFYARRMMNDGFLDERVVLRRWGLEVAEELGSNDPERPTWVRVESPRPGWRIHDFEKHHPVRAEIEAKRADVSSKRAEAGRKGAARRWQGDGKAIANDGSESESESQTETRLTPTESVSLGSNARANPTGLTQEEITRAKHTASGLSLDLDRIIRGAVAIDRDLDHRQALRLGVIILDKAKTDPAKPTAYVCSVIKKSWAEAQKWIDTEVML